MKVEFLKDHVNNKPKDVADLDAGLANYLVAVGVAKEAGNTVKDADGADAVEKVKKPTSKKKDAGTLEPVVNTKPDKNEVTPGDIDSVPK